MEKIDQLGNAKENFELPNTWRDKARKEEWRY
jgi:hypothetical protein